VGNYCHERRVQSRLHVRKVYRRYRFYLVRHFNNSIPTIITRIKLTVIFIFIFIFIFCSHSLGFLHSLLLFTIQNARSLIFLYLPTRGGFCIYSTGCFTRSVYNKIPIFENSSRAKTCHFSSFKKKRFLAVVKIMHSGTDLCYFFICYI
jgi:hypothetical protein